ncbi:MAG TPA: AMP-binding protein, partial [Actinomycetota bacterium]|nr:AMP-binding protein [Actinomycetota bacterium]
MSTQADMPAVALSPAAGTERDAWFGITEHLLASGPADGIAVIENGKALSYAQLRAHVSGMRSLYDALGLEPGDRVGILGSNSAFWIASYLAAMAGYVAVPLSDRLTPADAARQVEFADCRAIAIGQRQQRTFADAFGGRPMLTEADLDGADAAKEPLPVPVAPDADAALMFTSGTTARPKAVRLTHRNLRANTDSIVSYLELDATDRMLVVLPFHYCYGASLLHTHLRVGGSLVLCNTFTFPETAIETLDRECCTGFAGVPSTYQLLLRASTFVTRELPTLRRLQQAGGKLPPVMIEELAAAKPNARLFTMYGQTEATARLSYLPPELLREKLGSVGRGIPGVVLTVVDEAGDPVVPGVIGEIVAAGENISPGYLDDPEATSAKFPDGRLRTGDLAVVDSEGFIFIVD